LQGGCATRLLCMGVDVLGVSPSTRTLGAEDVPWHMCPCKVRVSCVRRVYRRGVCVVQWASAYVPGSGPLKVGVCSAYLVLLLPAPQTPVCHVKGPDSTVGPWGCVWLGSVEGRTRASALGHPETRV